MTFMFVSAQLSVFFASARFVLSFPLDWWLLLLSIIGVAILVVVVVLVVFIIVVIGAIIFVVGVRLVVLLTLE